MSYNWRIVMPFNYSTIYLISDGGLQSWTQFGNGGRI